MFSVQCPVSSEQCLKCSVQTAVCIMQCAVFVVDTVHIILLVNGKPICFLTLSLAASLSRTGAAGPRPP